MRAFRFGKDGGPVFRRFLISYVHSEQADPSRTVAKYSCFLHSPDAVVPRASDPRFNELVTAQLQAKLDEIGFKALLFDQEITASFAVFKTRRDGNIANEFFVEPGTNGVGTVNYNRFFAVNGEYVQGFAGEIFGQPTKRLTLIAGFAARRPALDTPGSQVTFLPVWLPYSAALQGQDGVLIRMTATPGVSHNSNPAVTTACSPRPCYPPR